jgi:hypothetical protein
MMRDACSGNPDCFLFDTLTATILSVLDSGLFSPRWVAQMRGSMFPTKVHLSFRHDIEIQVMDPACGVRQARNARSIV